MWQYPNIIRHDRMGSAKNNQAICTPSNWIFSQSSTKGKIAGEWHIHIHIPILHPYELRQQLSQETWSAEKKKKKKRGIFQAGGMEMKQQEGRRQKKLCTAAKANNSKQGRPWTDTFSRGPPDFRWCCCCLGRRTGEIINPNTKRNSNLRRGWNSKKGKEIPFFFC